MNERTRRLWAATEAMSLGWGGVTAVAGATGMARKTIHAGIRELKASPVARSLVLPPDRVRRPGGGRKSVTEQQPTIAAALEALVEPTARGDPQSPLRCRGCRFSAIRRHETTLSDAIPYGIRTQSTLRMPVDLIQAD